VDKTAETQESYIGLISWVQYQRT